MRQPPDSAILLLMRVGRLDMFGKAALSFFFLIAAASGLRAAEAPISPESRACINCHSTFTPGIVADWRQSRHSAVTPSDALKRPELQRRVSGSAGKLDATVVGCFECHGLNAQRHADNFLHYGYRINVVVSPGDCALCHPEEVADYKGSKKAMAWGNLAKNPLYSGLVNAITGLKEARGGDVVSRPPSEHTKQETCFACHGTVVRVKGLRNIKTPIGTIEVPELEGWPNQGVGRLNPDGTEGACTACHPRHSFSIGTARKPYTCSQCHLEPDVPAWNVWAESKHGNIFFSEHSNWDFGHVPWRLGTDFGAPTCAACHMSLITAPDGETVIARRSHDFGSRLWVRLFGLIYTHPQPLSGDTSLIVNDDGLPLPTTFAGRPALKYLIGEKEGERRQGLMTALCRGCHGSSWTELHFKKMRNTLEETDAMTLSATKLLQEAWRLGLADGSNPFDEAIEQKWIKQWLFYGNSVRYASAMTGAPDYAAFKYGWWGLTTNIEEMRHQIEVERQIKKK